MAKLHTLHSASPQLLQLQQQLRVWGGLLQEACQAFSQTASLAAACRGLGLWGYMGIAQNRLTSKHPRARSSHEELVILVARHKAGGPATSKIASSSAGMHTYCSFLDGIGLSSYGISSWEKPAVRFRV